MRRRDWHPADAGAGKAACNGRKDSMQCWDYRDEQLSDRKNSAKLTETCYVATEDGSAGTKGNVLDAIREKDLEADVIYACGPTAHAAGVESSMQQRKRFPAIFLWKSGWPAGSAPALACVCQTRRKWTAHSHVHNKRICKDGPVFLASEVEL